MVCVRMPKPAFHAFRSWMSTAICSSEWKWRTWNQIRQFEKKNHSAVRQRAIPHNQTPHISTSNYVFHDFFDFDFPYFRRMKCVMIATWIDWKAGVCQWFCTFSKCLWFRRRFISSNVSSTDSYISKYTFKIRFYFHPSCENRQQNRLCLLIFHFFPKLQRSSIEVS